jgi:hypothetical protein
MTPRERAAAIARQWCATPDDFYECAAAIEVALAEVVAQERERCAKEAEGECDRLSEEADKRHAKEDYDGYERFEEAASVASAIAAGIREKAGV